MSAKFCNSSICYLLGYVSVFVSLSVLIFLLCPYNFSFWSQISTFYAIPQFITDQLSVPGGSSSLISDLMLQYADNIYVGSCIVAALLSLITVISAWILVKISGKSVSAILSLAVPVSILPALCDINFRFAAVVSLALTLITLRLLYCIKHKRVRLVVSLMVTCLLWFATGPCGLLFGVLVFLVEFSINAKFSLYYLLNILLALGLAYYSVSTGVLVDMARALTPASYYASWVAPSHQLWLLWAVMLIVVLLVEGLRFVPMVSRNIKIITAICCTVVVIAFGIVICMRSFGSKDRDFSQLMYYAYHNDWEAIVEACKDLPMDDLAYQNCLHLALAERGTLAKSLFNQPCVGRRSIIDTESKSPYMFMLFSDIYYSMGHIALAQKYAFEANEAFGDMSPRLLRRLVDTNIIYGNYRVADKYLSLLESTYANREWAQERRQLLYHDDMVTMDHVLGTKRLNLLAVNDFAGRHGIEDDLLQILRANPKHNITMQYLGAMLLLSKDVPRFAEVLGEFYGTDVLPLPLPKHYQEAIVVASIASGQPLDNMYQIHHSVMERCRDFWSKHQDQPNTFWHYLKFVK